MNELWPPAWLERAARDAGLVYWIAEPDLRRFVYLSPGFEALWGGPVEPLYRDATPFFEATVPEGGTEPIEALGPLEGATEGPWSRELRIRRPDGRVRWIRNHGRPLVDRDGEIRAFAGVARDITAERRIDRARADTEAKLSAVFRAIPDLLLILDEEGRYQQILSGDLRQLYRPESELSGRLMHEVLPAELADEFLERVHEALDRDERVNVQYTLDIDGRTEWFDAILVPLTSRQVLWVARTVTERVELERQLAHARKLDALGQLAGGIAHDFNNVMTVIRGTTTLLAERIEDPGALADLTDIRKAAERASSLTAQLLAFSRQQVLKPERVDVSEVLDHTGRMLGRVIGENVELRLSTPGDPLPVLIDPGQLEQVVTNLVVNARHAIRDTGTIRVEADRVVVRADHELVASGELAPGPHVRLRVVDDGAGMPPDVVERAFEPFYSTRTDTGGTGLGLAAVYGTVRQSGGHIDIASRVGRGTTVRIFLPEAGDGPASAPSPATERAPPERPLHVLVVEDEAPVRSVIRRFVDGAGHHVLEAANGEEALQLAGSASRLDVVLTDMVMPRMGGAELIQRLRRARPELAVVLMSGYAGVEVQDREVAALADTYLSKPFTRNDLLAAIHEAANAPPP